MRLLFCLFFLFSARVYAAEPLQDDFDYRASLSAEQYPLGGLIDFTIGYDKLLWQDNDPEATGDKWKYGYLRPSFDWQTAGVTNRLTGRLEFFPISILGLSGGGGVDFRNYENFSGVDCTAYMCNEALSFDFLQAQLIAGAGKFVGIVTGRYDSYKAQSGDRPFYDYMSYLYGRAGSDDLRSLTAGALYRASSEWNYGLLAIYQEMLFSESNNGALFAVVNYSHDQWRATIGAGDYRSDHQPLKPSLFLVLSYVGKNPIGLLK